ncbi:MAG: Adaptive-response sensory-kinase SasA [bacterium]|nr:Adaptive-response sensory-kinase SasA [bacterium]
MRQKILLLAMITGALLNSTGTLHAQNQPITFEHISLAQGLLQSSITCIRQDRKGYLWFGTWDGLNKYNGYDFTIYKHKAQEPNSLSDDNISAIYEDRAGVLWIGTLEGGLNKFDREQEQFTHFVHDPKDPYSLSHNRVVTIAEDHTGTLWIGTRGGLNRFDRATGRFTHFVNEPNNSTSLSHNHVTSIYADSTRKILWIGTYGGGLNHLNLATGQFTRLVSDSTNLHTLSHNQVTSIRRDHTGMLWIGTTNGLNRFDPAAFRLNSQETAAEFARFLNDPQNPNSLSSNNIQLIYEDSEHTLWVGTFGGGLNRFDQTTGQFTRYLNDPKDPQSLSDNRILAIYEDRAGILWIGTNGGRLNKLDRNKERFLHVANVPDHPNRLSHNRVWAIYEDSRRTALWIGTQNGLDRFDPDLFSKEIIAKRDFSFDEYKGKPGFIHFANDPKNPQSLSNNSVRVIHEDSHDAGLWIGTDGGGLNKFNPKTKRFTRFVNDPQNSNSLSHNSIRTILEDHTGTLWIGTYGGGLNKFDRDSKQFTRFVNDPANPHSLSHNRVWAIYEDRAHTLWIGTSGGLDKLDRETGRFTHFVHDPANPQSLSHNAVFAIYEARIPQDGMWIGTYGGGLNHFDRATEKFTPYTTTAGLANDVIYGILEDDMGQLWMSTNYGLSCFDPQTKIFRNYDEADGLQGKEFNAGALFRSANGQMFFGGVNGLNIFYPHRVKKNSAPPPVVITSFKVFEKPLQLNRAIDDLTTITLSYRQNYFSFEFAALSYRHPEKNRYAHKLEGFDQDWIYSGSTRRYASYTNLDPGHYVFRVKGANDDGVWNENSTTLAIRITPPWWRTGWAYALYIILLAGVIAAVDRIQRRRVIAQERAQAEIREVELRAQTAELHAKTAEAQAQALQAENARKELELQKAAELQAAYQALEEAHADLQATQAQLIQSEKLASLGQLTAGVAHEIKNPLNFVNNFAVLSVDLAKELSEELVKLNTKGVNDEDLASITEILEALVLNAEKITHHGKRADSIVRSMMEHARGSSGQRQMTDINHLLDEAVNLSYHGMRAQDPSFNISIEKEYDETLGQVEVVPQDLQRVFINIINNACYAAHQKQKAKSQEQTANASAFMPVLSVRTRNCGDKVEIGIRDNGNGIPQAVRNKIFTPFFTTKPTGQGTGLGLSISYDIVVQLHRGELHVATETGKFTEFIIRLPRI